MKKPDTKNFDTKTFTLTALFLAIMLLLAWTPLGFIPIGPINATTIHIPVIVASIVLGPKIGGALGGVFGIVSCWHSTIVVGPTSFIFSPFIPVIGTSHGDWRALIVALVPRILIGIVPYFVFHGLSRLFKGKKHLSLVIAGVAGSMVNTILVMNLVFLIFRDSYAEAIGKGSDVLYNVILGVIFANGLPEALIAGVVSAAVCAVLLKLVGAGPRMKEKQLG